LMEDGRSGCPTYAAPVRRFDALDSTVKEAGRR